MSTKIMMRKTLRAVMLGNKKQKQNNNNKKDYV